MKKKLQELLEARAKIITEQRKMIDLADSEKRAMTSDEETVYANMDADYEAKSKEIRRLEAMIEREAELRQLASPPITPDPAGQDNLSGPASEEYRKAFWKQVRHTRNSLDAPEVRALQVGTDSEGGYLVPTEFEKMLINGLNDANIMRSLCTIIKTEGTRNIPVVSSHGTATWTAEEAAYTESDEAFGTVALSAHKIGTIMKVSEELLADSAFGLDAYVANEYGRRIGTAEEAAFVNGNGSAKPTGIVVGSGLGKTAASATAITADELIDLFHSLGRAYRQKAVFMMADATAKAVRKLKDGSSQYMWQPGIQAGQPDILLGRPVKISDSMPAMATGLKSVLFADFSYYWIADRGGRVFQRLNELYAANGQVGFRGYQRVDGKLTLAAAAKHLIQA